MKCLSFFYKRVSIVAFVIVVFASFIIGGIYSSNQAYYIDSPKTEVAANEEHLHQITQNFSSVQTLKFSPMREAAVSYPQTVSPASFTREWNKVMSERIRIARASSSGGSGKCPPCPPRPKGKEATEANPITRIDRVPPSKTHFPCPGDHTHYDWYEENQRPWPDCKCFWNARTKVECL